MTTATAGAVRVAVIALIAVAVAPRHGVAQPRAEIERVERAAPAPESGAVAADHFTAAATWLSGVDNGRGDGRSVMYHVDAAGAAAAAVRFAVTMTDSAQAPDGTHYAITLRSLWRLDPVTGAPLEVGSLGLTGANALAADASGRLFGATDDGVFFQVNPATGRAVRVGAYGGGLESSGDLAFAPDGTLYATISGTLSDYLATVDPNTGRAALLGALGYREVYGLAFSPDGQLLATANGRLGPALLLHIDIAGRRVTPLATPTQRGLNGLASMPPGAAALQPPAAMRATVSGSTVALAWQPSAGATSYVLEVGMAPGATALSSDVGGATALAAVAPPGTYYVRVRARRGAASSAPSNEVQVVVGGPSPCAPPPPPGAPRFTFATTMLTIDWAPSAAVASYVLEAGSASGLADVAVVDLGAATAVSLPRAAVPVGDYYVRIRAVATCGLSTRSADSVLAIRP